ncbi:MAG TPA: GGDEF domain-containing protein, partial [Jatrophihabitans sp.]|nr:GGDEF domain-containing protein [Jatrophihabitans sp.]
QPVLAILVIAPMVTLQRGALMRELETAASTDAKTGLLNPVAWEHLAQRELARAQRENYGLGVLIIDIDRFKRVNDEYGHLVGDHVLRGVGRCIETEVREYDGVGRFGGEEFVAVLPDVTELDALVIAERVRTKVNELRICHLSDGVEPRDGDLLSVSIGVSCAVFGGAELPDLLREADAALYRAKASGRNRVVLAEDGATGAPDRATLA